MEDFSDIIIATDLDGTFFGPKAAVIERNMAAVEWMKQRGGIFTIATGRVPANLIRPIPAVKELVNAPIISCNGALLYDVRNGETVAERVMDVEKATEVVEYSIKHFPSIGIRLSAPAGFITTPEFIENCPYIAKDFSSGCGVGRATGYFIIPLSEWQEHRWYKLVFRENSDTVDAFRSEIEPLYSEWITFSKSGPGFFEAQGRNVSKAILLPELLKYCEARTGKKMKLVCCGDYENDIDMLKAADLSVCPENATDEVKAIADLCLCHCSKGLIADVIEHIAREKGIEVKF